MTTIAIVAPGAMGSAIARRLKENGATVLTDLHGRSAATRARAEAAGMVGTDLPGLAAAELVLSIVPPAEAAAVLDSLLPACTAAARKPIFVDCNALDVRTVTGLGDVASNAGLRFVDAGIIGLPPVTGHAGPRLYLAGPDAAAVAAILSPLGVLVEAMDGPVGAASALKMSYAGITKGLAAIASIMVLGAERAGAGPALRAELARSQPHLLSRFRTSLPDMLPKAYRWVAEMQEIGAFLNGDPAGTAAFTAIAEFYARMAADTAGDRAEASLIERFVAETQP